MRVYLDNAATTPIRTEVIAAMNEVMGETYGNPSSIHNEGRIARATIEKARKTVAQIIGASIGEVFFTSGGTESTNMALKCAVRDLGVQHVITTPTEHHCVLHTAENLQKCNNIALHYVRVDKKGRISFDHLEELLQGCKGKVIVSIMHANNEIGTVQDIERIAHCCETHDAYFHSDTVQTVGHLPLDVSKIKIHFITGAAHKLNGPKGVGFIYVNNEAMLKPFIDGGGQERQMRGGTENIYGIVGLAKALELSYNEMETNRQHIESVRSYLIEQLRNNFDDIRFNGDYEGNYLYTVLSVSFPPSPKSDLLLLSLDIAGVSASGGSACSSGAEIGSHVLKAIGANGGRKTIRFSFSHFNTTSEIDFLIKQLKAILPQGVAATC